MFYVSNKFFNVPKMAHGGGRLTAHIRRSRRINQLAFVAFAVAAILPVILINPPVKEQQEASATTGTATAATTEITLTTEESRASVDIESLDPIGSFAISEDEETATFTLTTNNYTGYTLSIKTDDGAGTLSAETEGDTLASIEASTQYSAFSAKTAEAAENYNGKWGIKPSKYMNGDDIITNDSEDPVFLPSPTTTPTKLDKTTSANAPNTANEYTLALGVRADYTVHSGSYTRVFQLVALANPVAYSITFNKNTTDTVSNMPANQSSDAITETTITLANTVPTREHYSFLGWCSVSTTTNNGVDSCAGTIYNPNGNGTNLAYGIDQTIANITTLYAMWKLEKFTINLTISGGANEIIIDGVGYSGSSVSLAYGTHTISGSYNSGYEFGSWATSGSVSVASTSSTTTTMTVSGAGTLTLNGKSKLYLQNVTSATCPTTATTVYDSRDEEAYTIQKLADGKCWLLDNLALDLSTTRSLTTADTNIASDWTAPTDITTWSNSYTAPKINTESKNTTQSYGSGSGKIGVYYNYCAATAGTYCYADDGSGTGNATSDICPKGWRMPTGGFSGEYQALYTAYSSNATNFKNALRTPLSGYFSNSSANDQGSSGFFWSATVLNRNTMFSLRVNSSNVLPTNYYDRNLGFLVRCVLKGPASDISQISTMQDFATSNVSAVKDSMAFGQAYTLTDSRDGTSYAVGKLEDGTVWMLDNLDLPGGTTLTAADSNVISNYTLPASSTSGFSDASTAYVYNSGSTTCTSSSPCYSYYSYAAATAGTNPSSGNATSDICPKGWRLPTQVEHEQFDIMTLMVYNASAGYYFNSSFLDGGIEDSYWSSTAYNGSYAYYLTASGDVSGNYKSYGLSVRCVLK